MGIYNRSQIHECRIWEYMFRILVHCVEGGGWQFGGGAGFFVQMFRE